MTLFALTPALPLHVEGQYSMQASVDLPNGTTRRYDARSEGYVSFTLFYPAVMAGKELDGKATEENLQAIVARMRSDPLLVEALR